jgi:predicted transcriptional regulator
MRTTIELTDDQRARLLALAARRGEKGFSRLVQQAIEEFLAKQAGEDYEARRKRALAAIGSLSDEEADEMRATVREMRKRWRA